MNHVASRRPASKARSTPQRRDDVEALIALVSLDQGMARREATAASSLAIVERMGTDIASGEGEITATRDALKRTAESGAETPEVEEQCADLPARRAAITSRIPRATREDYETALRHGLFPAAVATRGRVCWGCFHRLSAALTAEFQEAQLFVCCPHCERVLFNPDWSEAR